METSGGWMTVALLLGAVVAAGLALLFGTMAGSATRPRGASIANKIQDPDRDPTGSAAYPAANRVESVRASLEEDWS